MSPDAHSEPILRLRGLGKVYPGTKGQPPVEAVSGLDLDVREGELLVLVGPSASGKTTTLRLIAGLEEATSGTIEIAGKPVNGVEPQDRGIAMVFQSPALYPHMSAFQNIAFGLKLAGKGKAEIRDLVMRAAAALELEGVLDRPPQALSGGQRQRVALARAMVRSPRVLLLDEPLSNLDARLRVQMRGEIARLQARLRTTMVYVTHDQVEAMVLGQRIAVIHEGRVAQVDEPLAVYRRPANLFVAGFIGNPPMNLLPGRIQRRDGGLCFVEEGGASPMVIPLRGHIEARVGCYVDKAVVLGLRPEHVAAASEAQAARAAVFTVESVEQLGAESILYLGTGGRSLVTRAAGDRYTPGDVFRAEIDVESAHLFDSETGRLIEGDP